MIFSWRSNPSSSPGYDFLGISFMDPSTLGQLYSFDKTCTFYVARENQINFNLI
jgi:hypothetical protein